MSGLGRGSHAFGWHVNQAGKPRVSLAHLVPPTCSMCLAQASSQYGLGTVRLLTPHLASERPGRAGNVQVADLFNFGLGSDTASFSLLVKAVRGQLNSKGKKIHSTSQGEEWHRMCSGSVFDPLQRPRPGMRPHSEHGMVVQNLSGLWLETDRSLQGLWEKV